jgi:hypothetical protein
MSFVKREISLTVNLGTGENGLVAEKTIVITGLRIACDIVISGYGDMPSAQLQIFGLSQDLMNELSTVGNGLAKFVKNSVIICAGDAGSPLSQVFDGQITAAWADYHQAPNVSFNIQARTGADAAILAIAAEGYKGTAYVADMLEYILGQINEKNGQAISFKNNGVDAVLEDQYLSGSARDQCFQIIKAAQINWNNFDNNSLEIWPMGGNRSGNSVLVSTETGMVGYPAFTYNGMIVTTLFNHRLRFGVLVEVKSSLEPANQKDWWVAIVTHELDSQIPNGRWFSTIDLRNPNVDKPLYIPK